MNVLPSSTPVLHAACPRVLTTGLIAALLLSTGCQQEPADLGNSFPPPKSADEADALSGRPAGDASPDEARPVTAGNAQQSLLSPDESAEKPAAALSETKVPDRQKRKANRLARETSPYLLLHAHNPVDWYPWGPEAFETAKREDRLIFLSIGYSSCYWCHVMERMVFENEDIAEFMNANFVNIKVDREERPDVDDIYMTSLQVYFSLSGSGQGGGWPLSMFLTPDGKPVAGGTYFPPEPKDGRPGFPQLCERIVEVWKTRREEVEQGGETIANIVRQEMKPSFSLEKVEITRELVETVTRTV
ncbi:MAG: thioredoxin domain-containing protein, partial [Planctomycetaceae bacterium]